MPWHHHIKGQSPTHQSCLNAHAEDTHEARLTANERVVKDRIRRSKTVTYMPRLVDPFWVGLRTKEQLDIIRGRKL